MKQHKLFSIFFVLINITIVSNSLSQNTHDEITIEELRSPTTPSFILMGISPKEIEKPQTPKAFSLMILNLIKKGDLIPKNFSLEFTPYWFFSHPNLSFSKFFGVNGNDEWQSIKQTFAISFATTPLDSPSVGTSLGLGIHTVILPGVFNKKLKEQFKSIKENAIKGQKYSDFVVHVFRQLKKAKNINDVILQLSDIKPLYSADSLAIHDIQASIVPIQNGSLDSANIQDSLNNIKEAILGKKDITIKEFISHLNEINQKKVGFKLELSSAITGNFANDSVQNGKFSKLGIWLTPNYSWENVDLLATVKYTRDFQADSSYNAGYVGLRAIISNKGFGFSAECIAKFLNKHIPTYKYSVNLDYKISDNSYITGSFGKDFTGNLINSKGNLFSVLGINIGLGRNPIVKLQ